MALLTGCPFVPETVNFTYELLPPRLSTSKVVPEPKFDVGRLLLTAASATVVKVIGTDGKAVAVSVADGVAVGARAEVV